MVACSVVQAQHFNRLAVCGTEPVRELRVELSDLARAHGDVVLAEDQAHLAAEHVQPLIALVNTKLRLSLLRRDQYLPGADASRVLAQRDNDPPVALPRLRPDPRVANFGCADELVERHLVDVGDRQEQLEAWLALPRLETGEGALRDPGLRGELGQGHTAMGPQSL